MPPLHLWKMNVGGVGLICAMAMALVLLTHV